MLSLGINLFLLPMRLNLQMGVPACGDGQHVSGLCTGVCSRPSRRRHNHGTDQNALDQHSGRLLPHALLQVLRQAVHLPGAEPPVDERADQGKQGVINTPALLAPGKCRSTWSFYIYIYIYSAVSELCSL